jgi:alkanesulfonate monooxygenase SsuD/methylene tetrahydromethanopterin reductase-like flavin-dependent oxidoreductase (luciferase family)
MLSLGLAEASVSRSPGRRVANLPLRPPAVMAKDAASLEVLSGVRFELGLGAGGFPDVIVGYGGPRRTSGESVEALEGATDVIRLLWSEERCVSFDGRYCRLDGARPGPRRVRPMGNWVGGVQAADAASRGSQGRRLAAVARGAHA